MSYVLQAMQRAQAQRQAGQTVDLRVQTLVPAAGVVDAPERRWPWIWVAVVLVLLSVAGLSVAWLRRPALVAQGSSASGLQPVTLPTRTPVPISAAAPAVAPSVAAVPVAPRVVVAPAARRPASVAAPASGPAAADPSAGLPTRAQLSAALREQLPPLVVSGVVFADDPAQRMLVLDNQVLQAGAQVATDLRLEFIGQHASVLNLRGTRFVLSH